MAKEIDLVKALGTEAGILVRRFTVFVPNKDRDGQEIGTQRKWVLEAMRLLCEINGRVSATPPIEGGWSDGGEVVWENPVAVYADVEVAKFAKGLPKLREFLHRMGRETNQAETAFSFGDEVYRIRAYDTA